MTGVHFNQMANRPAPLMASGMYKTFRIMQPLSTHFRRATCQEIACPAFMDGWTYKKADLDERLLYLVTHAGKHYKEMTLELGGDVYLVFAPGQPCFQASSHVTSLDRPEFYYVGRGDYRSFSTRRATQFKLPDDWRDDFAEHLDNIKTEIDKG